MVRILTCGGTIDKVYFDAKSEFQVGEPQIAAILREANVTFPYEVSSILQKDSLDMTEEDRLVVRHAAEQCAESEIIITHGTDTMAETARALVGVPEKTIVLTGSLSPARFRDNDANFNIGCAIIAVQILPRGVFAAMNGRIFRAERMRKNVAANAFEESA